MANELTSLFLAENMKTRERHAQETTAFLKQEAENLSDHIEKLEEQISQMKQRADGALPELTQLNMQLLNGAERELTDIDRDIRSLEERRRLSRRRISDHQTQYPHYFHNRGTDS